jgi:hypothetical protein
MPSWDHEVVEYDKKKKSGQSSEILVSNPDSKHIPRFGYTSRLPEPPSPTSGMGSLRSDTEGIEKTILGPQNLYALRNTNERSMKVSQSSSCEPACSLMREVTTRGH